MTATQTLPTDLQQSEQILRRLLGPSEDIRFEPIYILATGCSGLLIFTEGLTDREAIERYAITPLASADAPGGAPADLAALGRLLVRLAVQKVEIDPIKVRDLVYRGRAAILIDGYAGAIMITAPGWEERPVQSAPSESGLRGPRDGFIENIERNIALVRRRLNDPNLTVKFWHVGKRSRTRVAVLHLADVANPRLVQEIESRVAAINFDGILDANQVREMLVGQRWSPFPKMESSERPDKTTAALLAGKAAVFVDNSPFVLVAPTTLMDTLWAADDYYTTPVVTAMMRLVRLIGTAATVFLSPLYIGIETFNPALVRSDVGLYLAGERAGIPLVPALEIMFLEIMMEVLHESTVRLPAKVGSAATVVGGLIIGQAAVQARLVSGIVVIVTAISAVGSFTLPGQEVGQVWRVIKWMLILAAMAFGVYGIFAASFILFAWLTSQDSFGTPYMAPVAPFIGGDLVRDSLLRLPWGRLRRRGESYRPQDPDRANRPQSEKYKDGGER